MAENLGSEKKFDPDAFRAAVAGINREKEKAGEYVSAAGAATKNAVDQLNLDKTALTFTAKLTRKESAEQSAVACATVTYMHAMGFFDQGSMLDGGSAIEVMRQIVADHDAGTPGAKSSAVAHIKGKGKVAATAH